MYSKLVANILRIFYVLCIYVYIFFALYILFAPWSYTSHRLMFFVVNTTENKAYLILSYLIFIEKTLFTPKQLISHTQKDFVWQETDPHMVPLARVV